LQVARPMPFEAPVTRVIRFSMGGTYRCAPS
jgi:hypothetical protein